MRRRMGRPGLLGTVARTAVVAGTASAVAGGVQRRQDQRAFDQQQAADEQQAQLVNQAAAQAAAQVQAQQAPVPAAPAPAAAPAADPVAKLRELGELKAQGLLTEEEFASLKARILQG